jgi:RNA-binding protein YhbY
MSTLAKFQIGKGGITPNVINSISLLFKNHKQVRISMLKSSGRNRETMKDTASEISSKLTSINSKSGFNFKIIGFTIILIKNSKV